MQVGSKRSAPLLPVVTTVLLCIAAFWLGRISVRSPDAAFSSQFKEDNEPVQRRLSLDPDGVHPPHEVWGPSDSYWKEIMNSSGVMKSRPPLAPGSSGMDSYVTQPFQVIIPMESGGNEAKLCLLHHAGLSVWCGYLQACLLDCEGAPVGARGTRSRCLVPVSGAHFESGVCCAQPFSRFASMQIVSRMPRIVVFPNFIDEERAQAIKDLASGHMKASQLALRKGETLEENVGVRTSDGTFLSSKADPSGSLAWLDERISAVTNVPVSHFEVRLPPLHSRQFVA